MQKKIPKREKLDYFFDLPNKKEEMRVIIDYQFKSQVEIKQKKDSKYDLDFSKMRHVCKKRKFGSKIDWDEVEEECDLEQRMGDRQ